MSRYGAMIAMAVPGERIDKVDVRQERKGYAEPDEERCEREAEGFRNDDGGENADTDIKRHEGNV